MARKSTLLLDSLKSDFSELKFETTEGFKWDAASGTVFLGWKGRVGQKNALLGLHELAHAVLKHEDYEYDIELVRMEAEAWERVKTDFCDRYGVIWDEELAQGEIDTYRDWLYKRSLCPTCGRNGWQSGKNKYRCVCGYSWGVNEDKFKRIYRK